MLFFVIWEFGVAFWPPDRRNLRGIEVSFAENGYFKARTEILLASRMTPRSLDDSSDREDGVAPRSSKEQKFHPRSDSSLNFNSVLPVVAENGQNEVSK